MSRETGAGREAIEAARAEGHAAGVAEGRRLERADVLEELRAFGRVLDRRDEPGSQVVAMVLDWVASRDEDATRYPALHDGCLVCGGEGFSDARCPVCDTDASPVPCGAPTSAAEGVDVSAAGAGVGEAPGPGDGRGGAGG